MLVPGVCHVNGPGQITIRRYTASILGTVNTADLSILVKNNAAFTVINNIFQTFRTIFSSLSVIFKIKQLKLP